MRWTLLIVGVAALMAQFVSAPVASAQTHKFTGDVWTEADSGRIVRASGATVYLWPNNADVTNVISSACTASTTDMTSWMIARQVLNDSASFIPVSAVVTRDLALLRSIAQLPHAIVEADSMGHFVFDSVPSGSYWVEAETTLNGRIVQWWQRTTLVHFPFRIRGVDSDALGGSRLGPLEFHSLQFCTSPEPRVGAAAFATDTPLMPTGRIYQTRELDRNVRVTFQGEPIRYPETLRKQAIPGDVSLSFVVDANGDVEMNSVRVIYSTDPAFVDPVKRALATMRFAPAEVQGKPVRSLVKQTFNFSIRP
jgi:TonB family protein